MEFCITADGSGLTRDRLIEWEQRDPEAAQAYMRQARADFAASMRAILRRPMEDLSRLCARLVAQYEKAHAAPPRQAPRGEQQTLARRRERCSRAHARRGPPSDDDPHDDDPPGGLPQPARADEAGSGDTDLNVVWREAMARFETVDEYLELANLALRRTEWLLEIGWGRRAA